MTPVNPLCPVRIQMISRLIVGHVPASAQWQMLLNPLTAAHSCIPLALACLEVNELIMGAAGSPRVHREQEAGGALSADASFLSGGSRPAVCAQPKNSFCLSCFCPISFNNGGAEQVMR